MLPKNSILNSSGIEYDYTDTFISSFEDKTNKKSSAGVCRAFFMASPKWVKFLFDIRNKIVKLFGLKTSELSGSQVIDPNTDIAKHYFSVGKSLGLFKIYNITEKEVILGQDDKHLNFRVSLFLDQKVDDTLTLNKDHRILSISTTVKFNNWFGKIYFFPVQPFHKRIVPSMLKEIIKHLESH